MLHIVLNAALRPNQTSTERRPLCEAKRSWVGIVCIFHTTAKHTYNIYIFLQIHNTSLNWIWEVYPLRLSWIGREVFVNCELRGFLLNSR